MHVAKVRNIPSCDDNVHYKINIIITGRYVSHFCYVHWANMDLRSVCNTQWRQKQARFFFQILSADPDSATAGCLSFCHYSSLGKRVCSSSRKRCSSFDIIQTTWSTATEIIAVVINVRLRPVLQTCCVLLRPFVFLYSSWFSSVWAI